MPSTSLIELKSKEACPACGKHKLFTNDSKKNDDVVHWQCLNCNHTFFEGADEKKDNKKKDDSAFGSASAIITMLVATILILMFAQTRQNNQEPVQPAAQYEQLN